jgi:hypothetical protein
MMSSQNVLVVPQQSTGVGESRVLGEGQRPSLSAVAVVPIDCLLPADSPRTAGEDRAHTRVLADSGALLPPIIVHRPTMRVVDGMHRLMAAGMRGEQEVCVRFFEGDERDAFLIAVRENTAHGLPLSARDRALAAARILRSHPHWSDPAVALAAGLSARTVGEIRRASLDESEQPAARLGRDGRVRPLNSAEGRIRASQLITEMPGASLRAIAHRAGISPGTVRDVRDRMSRGEDPVPASLRASGTGEGSPLKAPSRVRRLAEARGPVDEQGLLRSLMKDPSLRLTERGRFLLRLLGAQVLPDSRWTELKEAVPEHGAQVISQLARKCASAWTEFADDLERAAADSSGE